MESSKHNDELIKRKLDGLSIEPRKLKFAEVKANYDKAKDASSNRWGLYFIFGCIGIAALLSTYFLLTPNTSDQLAENTVATEYSAAQNIQSVGTTSEDKSLERSDDKTNLSDDNKSINSTSEVSETNTDLKTTNEYATKETEATELNNSASKNSVLNKKSGNNTSEEAFASSATEKKTSSLSKKENNTRTNSGSDKRSATEKNEILKNKVLTNTSGQTKIAESVNKAVTKKQDQNTPYLKDVKETNNKTTDTQPLTNSDVNTKAGDQTLPGNKVGEKNDIKDIAKNETSENNNGKADQSTATKAGSNDQNNSSNTNIANTEGKNESSADQAAKTDSVSNNIAVANKVDTANASSHIPGVIGTGSVSPRNKHKFLIGAEVSYSTLFYNTKENPNSPSQFSTGDPAFTTAYANALGKGKHSLFNGAAYLSYVYNEGVGISAGVSYFNLETKVDVQASRIPEYTTAIDYFVWNWVQDSSVFPPTLSLQIVDTAYKQVPTGNYNTVQVSVNGDSASTLNYVNKIRYISIPLNLSYNFKIGAKFSIEPQAGVIYTMPLRSSHLVATDAYKFEYKKQKTDLRSNLYFNAALKIGYNINNRTQLYIREGYFFRNNSIYNSDQAISLSLKSIYTSFGITYRLK
jgi:hypothetical protein